jgi:hypothetical protein
VRYVKSAAERTKLVAKLAEAVRKKDAEAKRLHDEAEAHRRRAAEKDSASGIAERELVKLKAELLEATVATVVAEQRVVPPRVGEPPDVMVDGPTFVEGKRIPSIEEYLKKQDGKR